MVDESLLEGSNYFYDNSFQNKDYSSQILNFNPLDKVVELCSEKDKLYERIIELEKEKSALMGQMLKEKK